MKCQLSNLVVALALCAVAVADGAAQDKAPAAAQPAARSASAPVKPGTKAALTVTLVQPQAREVPLRLAANGSVAAWQEAILGTEVNGLRLSEVRAQVGDTVKRGQVLAVFAAETVEAEVAQARASVAEAEATQAEARANAERAQSIAASGALSAQQVAQYATAEKTAQARLESARAQLAAQRLRLAHTKLVASDDGIISARSATVGAVVPQGQELFRLIRKGRLEWRGEVTATELGKLKPGLAVAISATGVGSVEGRLRMVGPTVDAVTRNALVYVDLPDAMAQGLQARHVRARRIRARRQQRPHRAAGRRGAARRLQLRVSRRAGAGRQRQGRARQGRDRPPRRRPHRGALGPHAGRPHRRHRRRLPRRWRHGESRQMNVSAWWIRNPMPALMLFVLLCFGGVLSFSAMKVQNFPDLDLPTINISASLPGAAPAQLETDVARKLENSIATLQGLKHIYTKVQDGSVTITAEFRLEKPVQEAVDDVRSAVSKVRADLPGDLRDPIVNKLDLAGSPCWPTRWPPSAWTTKACPGSSTTRLPSACCWCAASAP